MSRARNWLENLLARSTPNLKSSEHMASNQSAFKAASTNVLVHNEILARIRAGELVVNSVEPEKRARGCSFDLTVGTIFWGGRVIRKNPAEPQQVVVPPGGVVGIFTEESLKLPADIYGTAFAINAMSSRGFLVLNSGHVDPGFEGPLTVKALNVRKTSIAISQGEPIFTVLFTPIGQDAPLFKSNKSALDREREFNAETVQSSPQTLGEVIAVDPNGPFPTRDQVRDLVRKDAIVRLTLGLTFIAAVASVLALFGVQLGGKHQDTSKNVAEEAARVEPSNQQPKIGPKEPRNEAKLVESK